MFDLARALGIAVDAVVLPDGRAPLRSFDVPTVDESTFIEEIDPISARLINGIGPRPGRPRHLSAYLKFSTRGFDFPSLVDPTAVVRTTLSLGAGTTIIAGAVIQSGVRMSEMVVVNTAAVVDHDCVVGTGAFVGPNATLCGGVKVGARSFIGAGAILLPGVEIGEDAIVGAGCTISEYVGPGSITRL
jgi:UDP-perosamine 4-acetyltransferase